MEIQEDLPKFDIPEDFMVGDNVTGQILNFYRHYPCRINAGLFVLVIDGEIDCSINLSKYCIRKNDFVTLSPSSFIQIDELRGPVRLHFVAFSGNFVESINFFKSTLDYLPVIVEHPVMELSDDMAQLCTDFIWILLRAKQSEEVILNHESFRSIMNFFLFQISGLYKRKWQWEKSEETRDNVIYKEFMQLLMKNYMKEHSVSYYSKELGITLQHFCNTIKKATGSTALQIITNVIIMDAKAQLKATDLPIKEIAITLGFTNQAFFNKYFKQHVGMTPLEYRMS